ncbi:MAG: GNAT family N-acetyltransferase [Acidimicrobiales bacterium]
MELPTLRTERLVLMPLGPADLDEAAVLYSSADVMRYVAGGPLDRAETVRALDECALCWARDGWGLWAIRDATSGALLGEAGLQPLEGIAGASLDFGITLKRRAWGRGIATEAGSVVLTDSWQRHADDEIHALVDIDNRASRRVLEKLGFELAERVEYDDRAHELWAAARPTDRPTTRPTRAS